MVEQLPNARVTIVTVSFNSTGPLSEMLNSVPEETPVVIVENGDKDLSGVRELARRPNTTLIENQTNEGFGVACNLGAASATTKYLLFLNPDALLSDDTLTKLVAASENYPHASAFNPRIEQSNGRPYFRRSSYLLPRSEWMPRGWPMADSEVPILSGAAIFVSRKNFDKVKGFDPKIFLFYEDDDLSIRLRRECGPIMFIKDASIKHIGGSSSERSPEVARLKALHKGHSRVYAAKKYGRPFARSYALLQATWQVFSPLVLVSKRKRAKQLALLRGVVQASFR